MWFPKLKHSMSLRSLSRYFTVFFIIATLTLAVFSHLQLSQIQRAKEAADRSFFSYQLELVSDSAGYINAYLFNTLVNNESVQAAQSAADTLAHNHAFRQIQATMDYENKAFHSDFSYMFYVLGDSSIISRASDISYAEDERVRNILIERIDSGAYNRVQQDWRCDRLGENYFLFQVFCSGRAYMCAWIKCDNAFDFFLGNNSYQDAAIEYRLPKGETPTYGISGKTIYSFEPKLINARLDFLFADGTNFEAIKSVVAMFLLAFLLNIAFYLYVMSYYSRNIARPLKALKDGIATIESLPQMGASGISELNDANSALVTLKNQLESIKVQYYESQIDLVKTELDYFMLQIRPHFFINCLNIIHSMIQKESYQSAQQFCVHLSCYIRYLFSDSLCCVPLKDELSHLNLYLKIQNIRSHSDLFIDENISANAEEALVPPLLLVTFVENSIKYSMKCPEELVVDLSVNRILERDERYLSIMISDNGVGFPEDYIEQFNSGEIQPRSSADGIHNIGIQNIYKRMSLLYGENFSLKIMNNHGANILIQIPFQLPQTSAHEPANEN